MITDNRQQTTDNERKYPVAGVGVFIFNNKGELLLIKSPKRFDKYIAPGGKIEYRESVKETVKREVKEETGLEVTDIEFVSFTDDPKAEGSYRGDAKHLIMLDYRARLKHDEKISLNDESIKYKWLKPNEWLKRDDLYHYTKRIIEKYLFDSESYEHKYKRALADYQNLLKRTADEKADFARYANEQLLHEILPVYDNLKISLEHIDEQAQANGWAQGIKYVVKQFKDALADLGIEEIEAKGKKFDPNYMDALEGQGERVKKVVKPGYKLNGKVIIPAKVVLDK